MTSSLAYLFSYLVFPTLTLEKSIVIDTCNQWRYHLPVPVCNL